MKVPGNGNAMTLNTAAMIIAMQEWANKHFAEPVPIVTNVRWGSSGGSMNDCFIITLGEPQEQPTP